MDYLIKQSSKVRVAGKQTEEVANSKRQRRIPPQKNPSLKTREHRAGSVKRISWQMNQDYDLNEIEQATAVAAAAYAIVSIIDSSSPVNEPSLDRRKSRPELESRKDSTPVSGPSREFSGKDSMRNSEIEEEVLETAALTEKSQEKVIGPSPSITRTPTFTDKLASKPKKVPTFANEQLDTRDEIQPRSLMPKIDMPAIEPQMTRTKSDLPITSKPAISSPKIDRSTSTKPETVLGGTEADAWERAELAKIKKRYEEVDTRILSWENKKKRKSRHRLDRTESELVKKRLKALEKFRSEIDDINQIAEGARSKARERREHEEKKAKEKANTFRKTGKFPSTCSCF